MGARPRPSPAPPASISRAASRGTARSSWPPGITRTVRRPRSARTPEPESPDRHAEHVAPGLLFAPRGRCRLEVGGRCLRYHRGGAGRPDQAASDRPGGPDGLLVGLLLLAGQRRLPTPPAEAVGTPADRPRPSPARTPGGPGRRQFG